MCLDWDVQLDGELLQLAQTMEGTCQVSLFILLTCVTHLRFLLIIIMHTNRTIYLSVIQVTDKTTPVGMATGT